MIILIVDMLVLQIVGNFVMIIVLVEHDWKNSDQY
jgi:hypothetical protein